MVEAVKVLAAQAAIQPAIDAGEYAALAVRAAI
jgi:hypothetical protein